MKNFSAGLDCLVSWLLAIAAALLAGISVTFGMTQVLAWLEKRRQVLAAPFGGANARAM